MAIERIGPIVDANGDPYYVVERDYIGAEHLNAQAAWTRKVHPVLRRQHNADGVHDWLPIPRAAILGTSGFYSGSGHVTIDPRTRCMGYKQAINADDPDPDKYVDLVTAQYLAQGEVRFTLAVPLPSPIYGLINLLPGTYWRGSATSNSRLERMQQELVPISATVFDVIMKSQSGQQLNGEFSFLLVC